MDEEVQPPPWGRFSSWVHGVCVVTFDLELGQALETLYPAHVSLSETDKSNICYLAFPDSNSGVMGDSQFHFRVRLSPTAVATPGNFGQDHQSHHRRPEIVRRVHEEYNRRCSPTLALDPAYVFGFAYFRQVKDSSIRRGYFQKSVILLTKLPLVGLFPLITAAVARSFFDSESDPIAGLEKACADIDRWPFPVPGRSLDLRLAKHLFQVFLPDSSTRSATESGAEVVTLAPRDNDDLFLPNCQLLALESPDLFGCLYPLIDHVQALWELVLTAEPLVVMSPTPSLCSATVQHLVSIIHPLTYCADYRPFYTIHDSDFKDITSCSAAAAAAASSTLPNVLLGVTNPFFSKALSHWPHIVKHGSHHLQQGLDLPHSARNQGSSPSRQLGLSHSKSSSKLESLTSSASKAASSGLCSASKPFLDKDKALVKRIRKGVQLKRPDAVQSAMIRRHFLELTSTFIIPLERYLASLMPLAKNVYPFGAAPKVRPFSADEFLASLESPSGGPQLTSTIKGDWEGLYRRFLKSPNFVGWYGQRHREASQKLKLLHLESLAESNIKSWMEGKEEVQLVDMILRIRTKLTEAESDDLQLSDMARERLKEHVATVMASLPNDLRNVLGNETGGDLHPRQVAAVSCDHAVG